MKQCPVCEEGSLSLEEDIRTEIIGGKECEITLLYWLCDACGVEQVDDKLSYINRKLFLEMKARYEHR